jgi:hypothetical protein
MKNKIEQIILKAIGEDKVGNYTDSEGNLVEVYGREYANAYNQAKAELRGKAPDIAEKIIKEVVGEIVENKSYIEDDHYGLGWNNALNQIINHLTK